MDIIDRLNKISLWGLRLTPIVLLCLLMFQYHIIGRITFIIEALILFEYYILVVIKFPKHEIAEGPLTLLLFQLSIVVYALIENEIVKPSSPFTIRIIASAFLIAYMFMTYWIIKGFVLQKKEEELCIPDCPSVDSVNHTPEAVCLLNAVDEVDKMQLSFEEQRTNIDDLKVPIPSAPSEDNPAPFVNYLKEVSDLPTRYPALASLEQFFEIMCANQDWDNFFNSLESSFDIAATGTGDYLHGLKDVLFDTRHAITEYIHHPDHETTSKLIEHALKTFTEDAHSSYFRICLSHAEGIGGKAAYVLRKFATDSLKGGAESFVNSEDLHHLNADLADSFHEAFDNITSSVPQEIDVDIFSPDFDGSGHFPFITTAIEAFKLANKWTDGDIDMVSAAEKSAVKIAGTAGGAYMGSAIGTLICPGVGTAIGAMIGGWLGRRAANSVNRQELERLQQIYEEEYNRLNDLAVQAKQVITSAQQTTANQIMDVAIEEHASFENAKESDPFEKIRNNELVYAVDIILRSYIIYFLKEQQNQNSTDKKLKSYIPTLEQIRLYPKESLELMLAAQKHIKTQYNEDEYYNYEVVIQACIEMMVKNLALYKTLQCTWYTEMYDAYRRSISNVLSRSDSHIKEYVDIVRSENDKIDRQKQVVDEAEQNVRDEARTL